MGGQLLAGGSRWKHHALDGQEALIDLPQGDFDRVQPGIEPIHRRAHLAHFAAQVTHFTAQAALHVGHVRAAAIEAAVHAGELR